MENQVDTVLIASGSGTDSDSITGAWINGCIPEVNIHPADPHKHGGDGMYGLEVHRRVIMEIVDKIKRGKNAVGDKFYSCPTVHEVEMEYDSGHALLTGDIEIPEKIIHDVVEENISSHDAAKQLQQVVLLNEWLMLPTAVRMAARKILSERSG